MAGKSPVIVFLLLDLTIYTTTILDKTSEKQLYIDASIQLINHKQSAF